MRSIFLPVLFALPTSGAVSSSGPAAPASAPVAPREDAFTRAVQTALSFHRDGDETRALTALYQAVDEARLRAPLSVHDGAVLEDYPQNLGIYKTAPSAMVFQDVLLLYLEVDNHGLHRRPDGFGVDLYTDVFILFEDGEKIGGKERFGEHKLVSRVPYRTTHMVLEVGVKGLPAQAYQARVVVHDAVSGKSGEIRIPFRVAARPKGP